MYEISQCNNYAHVHEGQKYHKAEGGRKQFCTYAQKVYTDTHLIDVHLGWKRREISLLYVD